MRQQPILGAIGIEQGFWRGERLGSHNEQRTLRVQALQIAEQMGTIDVGNKVRRDLVAIRSQGTRHQHRPQIGATNANIHHVGNGFAGVTTPFTATHPINKAAHLRQHGIHFRHHIHAINQHRGIRAIAQCRMQHRTIFTEVDLVATTHALHPAGEIDAFSQINQQPHGFIGHAVLRIIEEQIATTQRITLETLRIDGKQIAHVYVGHLLLMAPQGQPRGRLRGIKYIFHCFFLRSSAAKRCYIACRKSAGARRQAADDQRECLWCSAFARQGAVDKATVDLRRAITA